MQVADESILGDYKDREKILELAGKCDVMTFEIESVNADALKELVARGFPVHPTPHTLGIIKDKLLQKQFLQKQGIPVAPFLPIESDDDIRTALRELGSPIILKARSGGFDGRGNALVRNEADIPAAREKLKGAAVYAEGFVHFVRELAVVAARTQTGETAIYPLVETIHKDHICHTTLAPAPVAEDVAHQAHDVAARVLAAFDGAGVFGIELFLTSDPTIGRESTIINEIAPRVHNSGHWTIEGCETSQFENHIRAVAGLPLGSVAMKAPAAVMVNILGEQTAPAEPRGVAEAEALGDVAVHIYGKLETKPARKMGHLTATGATLEDARAKAETARAFISI
jgi:phosphoribosylaminoimidazole carboxylase PurK protein